MKAEKVLVELPTLGNFVNAVQLAMGVAEKHNAQKIVRDVLVSLKGSLQRQPKPVKKATEINDSNVLDHRGRPRNAWTKRKTRTRSYRNKSFKRTGPTENTD